MLALAASARGIAVPVCLASTLGDVALSPVKAGAKFGDDVTQTLSAHLCEGHLLGADEVNRGHFPGPVLAARSRVYFQVLASSLWSEGGACVFVIRRPGTIPASRFG